MDRSLCYLGDCHRIGSALNLLMVFASELAMSGDSPNLSLDPAREKLTRKKKGEPEKKKGSPSGHEVPYSRASLGSAFLVPVLKGKQCLYNVSTGPSQRLCVTCWKVGFIAASSARVQSR